jgi:hypothetical protein
MARYTLMGEEEDDGEEEAMGERETELVATSIQSPL